MKRKTIAFFVILALLFSIVGCSNKRTTVYDMIVKATPESITATTPTIDSVKLLCENIMVVAETTATKGVATFETNGEIYALGHQAAEPVGSFIVKIDPSNDEIESSNLIGRVISNTENGVIAEQCQTIREYSSIPIAKTAQLGEAFILGRDSEGNIHKYSIFIEAFKEDQSMFFYSSSEVRFEEGLSGSPIVQNNELIGVHFGHVDNEESNKKGAGLIIWDLEILNP